MKSAIISAALVFASSAFAAPTEPMLQAQITTLEVQILTVINDIVQSSPTLKADWKTGASQFRMLANELAGPQPCSTSTSGYPKTSDEAIMALRTSQEDLMMLSLSLENPANSVADGDFHADVCTALRYFSSTSKFIGA